MSVTLKYKVDNIEIFWSELMRFVDTNDSYTGDFLLAPWDSHSDYVGEIMVSGTIFIKWFLTPFNLFWMK